MQLQVSDQIESKVSEGQLSPADASRFTKFVATCNAEFMTHPVITDNKYSAWFAEGAASRDNVKHFVVQFSVFSNLFLIAQLMKVINAGTLEGMRASKEILANELGVIFHKAGNELGEISDKDREGDPEIVALEGSVDGGRFRFRAAHFEWLLKMGQVLDLGFNDLGKRRNGTPSTLFFCDQLMTIYRNEDPNIAEGASFAVENWAAAGFWKELIAGLESFKQIQEPKLPLAFFTDDFDEEKFLYGGRLMLDGVQAFWTGLNEQRIAVAHTDKSTPQVPHTVHFPPPL